MSEDRAEEPKELPLALQAHVPGKFFKMSDGTLYKVHIDGSWRKVQEGTPNKRRTKGQ